MTHIKVCIFDLDGVIVDTANYHFLAWQSICSELGIKFLEEDNERLKGISRVESLEILLEIGKMELAPDLKVKYLQLKNEKYLEYIGQMNASEMLPGVLEFMEELKLNQVKIGLGSASRNARRILNALNINHYFDVVVDGNNVVNHKPDPEVFLKGADQMNVPPESCVVFEDSIAGIEAAKAANFIAVGVGDKNVLGSANFVIEGFSNFTYTQLIQNISIRT